MWLSSSGAFIDGSLDFFGIGPVIVFISLWAIALLDYAIVYDDPRELVFGDPSGVEQYSQRS